MAFVVRTNKTSRILSYLVIVPADAGTLNQFKESAHGNQSLQG
jgi:hypothetical protein